LPVRTVRVMGDERTYDEVCAYARCAPSMETEIGRDSLRSARSHSSRITNEVRGINRVVYDISSNRRRRFEWE